MIIPNSSFTTTEKRIEVKEVFSLFDIPKVQKAIQLSKFAFRKPFPDRQINSIYFDDFSFSSFEDSIEGNCLRTKNPSQMVWK